MTVLEPAALELSLGAGDDLRRERERLDRQWQQRMERARYEADRAARRYHAVEPENRLVGRELERRWEHALAAVRDLEEQYGRFRRDQPAELTAGDRDMIMSLASDIPALWRAPTTTASDRRVVVRHLIERVEDAVQGETEWADVVVHWSGGFVSRHEVRRPVRRLEQLRDYTALMDRVLELHRAGRTSGEIADRLNAEGFRPAKRRATFNCSVVRQMLSRHFRSGPRPRALTEASPLEEHEWWLTDLARELGMPVPTVHCWLRRGWITARKLTGAGGRWILWADDQELDRLRRLRASRRGWADQPYPPELTSWRVGQTWSRTTVASKKPKEPNAIQDSPEERPMKEGMCRRSRQLLSFAGPHLARGASRKCNGDCGQPFVPQAFFAGRSWPSNRLPLRFPGLSRPRRCSRRLRLRPNTGTRQRTPRRANRGSRPRKQDSQ